ncbi:MAG: ATP cone domain-containing protein [Candidatus Njordarchaeota archaeon]
MGKRKRKVIKMDGSVEEYQRQKLVSSLMSAGAPEDVANKIADKIEEKISEREEITTRELREQALEELGKENPEWKDNWVFYDRIVKGRVTYERGKFVVIKRGKLYLGREVRDIGEPGLSDLEEVKGILRELEEDLEHGISRRTIASRTYVLYMAVLRNKKMDPETKKKAIDLINEFRKKNGWKPFVPKKPIQ